MKREKRVLRFVLMSVSCLALAVSAHAQEFKLGTLLPLTGVLKEWGPHLQNAVELAAKQMSSAGFEIELVHTDTETTAQAAEKAAKKLVHVDKVAAIVGAGSSGVTVAAAETVTLPSGVLMISPASTSPYLTEFPGDEKADLLFRTCPSDALQGAVLGKLAASLYRSASVMYVNNPYGQGLANQFRKSFQKRGGTIYATIPHDAETVAESYEKDLREAFAKVYLTKPFRSGKSDVLVVLSYPEHAKVYVKEAIEVFKNKNFLFCDGSKSEELAIAVGPENLEGMMGTAPGTTSGEGLMSFVSDYKEMFGELPTVPFVPNAYDATAVIGLAAYSAKQQGLPMTSENIRNQLRSVANPPGTFVGPHEFEKAFELLRQGKAINYEGAAGSVDFDENGDVVTPIEVWKYSNGKIVTYRMDYEIPQ